LHRRIYQLQLSNQHNKLRGEHLHNAELHVEDGAGVRRSRFLRYLGDNRLHRESAGLRQQQLRGEDCRQQLDDMPGQWTMPKRTLLQWNLPRL
jgi:hypothetical protein